MRNLKKLARLKHRSILVFIIGGLVALAGAAKLAPDVHRAKIQDIGGGYAKKLANQIATHFLKSSGAIDTKTWTFQRQYTFRLKMVRPKAAWWTHPHSTKQRRAILNQLKDSFVKSLPAAVRAASAKPKKKKALKKKALKKKALKKTARPPKKLLTQAEKQTQQKKRIAARKNRILEAITADAAGQIYEALGLGKAGELSKAAVAARKKNPPPSWGWASTWLVFFVGCLFSLGGLLLWRRTQMYELIAQQQGVLSLEDNGSPFVLLASAIKPLQALHEDLETLDNQQLCDRVDQILNQFILPLALVRHKITERLGMREGAEILVTIAFAERMLNRVWSASADGAIHEARTVYPDAVDAFLEAQTAVERLT